MASCVNQSELLLDDVINETFSAEDSNVDATVRNIINTVALPTVCVFGIVGNILNLTILTRRKLQKSFRSLEQAANLCLIALAVSDLMFCILAFLFTFVPGDVYEGKGFLYFYKMYSTAFINLFIMESTMLTVAMSLERYMAICFPLRQDLYLTTRRIKYIIVGSFLFSLAFNVPVLWRFESNLICPNSRKNMTHVLRDSSQSSKYNSPRETLSSAHLIEDENPVSPKNKSSTSQVSTTAISYLSTPSLSTSSSLHKNPKNPNSILTSSISSLPSSLLPKSKLSSSQSPSSSYTSSSSSSSPSSPSIPDYTFLGDKYHVRKVPLWGSQVYELAYRILWAIIGNFIPLVLLFFFNVCLCRNIYLSYKLRRQFKRQNQAKSSSHILTVTLVVIVVMFFILVAPSEIVLLAGTSPTMESIFNFLQSLNFSLNFILYCIISRHFRKTLKYIFLCGCYNIYQVSRDWKKEFETSLM